MGEGESAKVMFFVAYPVKWIKNKKGSWSWKYVGDEEDTTVIHLSKNASFDDLHAAVKDELPERYSRCNFELKLMPPASKVRPLLVNSNKRVTQFLNMCEASSKMLVLYLSLNGMMPEQDAPPSNIVESQQSCDPVLRVSSSQENQVTTTIASMDIDVTCMNSTNNEINVGMVVERCDEETVVNSQTSSEMFGEPLLTSFGEDAYLESQGPTSFEMLVDPLLINFGEDAYLESQDTAPALIPTEGTNDIPSEGINDILSELYEYIPTEDNDDNLIEGTNDMPTESNDDIPDKDNGDSLITMEVTSVGVDKVNIPITEDIRDGDSFKHKGLLVCRVAYLAVKYKFLFRPQSTNTTLYSVVCEAKGCPWRLRASKFGERQFVVDNYPAKHTCLPICPGKFHPHSSYKLLGRHYCHKFKDIKVKYSPRHLQNDFQHEFGFEVQYQKALKAKCYADGLIRGFPKCSFGKLPKYFYRLEQSNPGTVTKIEQKPNGEFWYCFMALNASIQGYKWMRKVVCVDGTHLKTRYKGVLLVATCQDGNRNIFPLAWAVVDKEKNESWTWFFQQLVKITDDVKQLTILSDRAESIEYGFKQVYKNARRGYCIWHMGQNMKKRYPKRDVERLFMKCAKAYTEAEFDAAYAKLDAVCPKLEEYLRKEEYPYWCRTKFDSVRYNVLTTNYAESINSKLLRPREFSIVGLFESIRELVQEWFAEHQMDSVQCRTTLTDFGEKRMAKRYERVSWYTVKPVSVRDDEWHVFDKKSSKLNYVVNLKKRTCTCRKYQLDKFACSHAVAAAQHKKSTGYKVSTNYYTANFWRKAYAANVYPLVNADDCVYPPEVLNRKVLPASVPGRSAGRPKDNKRKRAYSEGPRKRVIRCSKCKASGHNKASCSALIDCGEVFDVDDSLSSGFDSFDDEDIFSDGIDVQEALNDGGDDGGVQEAFNGGGDCGGGGGGGDVQAAFNGVGDGFEAQDVV